MTLGERIRWYRGRKGLSQEALAERVGVSRQAVSKWETDAAAPELDKLVALARAFGVTTDQLLTEELSAEEPGREAPPPVEDRLDRSAVWLGRKIRHWGWLSGVYLTLWGLGAALIGTLAYAGFKRVLFPLGRQDPVVLEMLDLDSSYAFPLTFAKIIIGIGAAAVITGVVLTIYLRRRR